MTTLTDIYDKMISNGSLEDDLCQREIVEQLENISRQISNLKKNPFSSENLLTSMVPIFGVV